jgi:hypothetical protein
VTGQNIQMLAVGVDPLYTALLVLFSSCPYLSLSFCPCHLVLSPSYYLLNLHPPKKDNSTYSEKEISFTYYLSIAVRVLKYE